MSQCPKCKKELPFIVDKKLALLYSFYLSIGSVALFIFIISGFNTIEAVLWQYTTKYIVNSAVLTLAALISGILLLFTCYLMLIEKKIAKVTGSIGCLILMIYPLFVLILEIKVPYSFNYILLLIVPAIIILVLSTIIGKKFSNNKSFQKKIGK